MINRVYLRSILYSDLSSLFLVEFSMAQVPASIAEFLRGHRIAVAGVSRNPRETANLIFLKFKDAGYEVVPVNPKTNTAEGVTCYPDLASIPWLRDIATNLVVSLIVFAFGYLFGMWRGRHAQRGRNLEQYDFYPFAVDAEGFPQFSLALFERGVKHLLRRPDVRAAGQMIVIGEQNGVRYQLPADALAAYEKLYARHHGKEIIRDSSEYLENYRRIVRLLGNRRVFNFY
jgi:hypothetical protein